MLLFNRAGKGMHVGTAQVVGVDQLEELSRRCHAHGSTIVGEEILEL